MADQYENVNFEEELAHEKEANEGEAAEYQRMLEKARKANCRGTPEMIKRIIDAKEDPVDDSEENVEAIVEHIVGQLQSWSLGGVEVHEFRKLVALSFATEWRQFSQQYTGSTPGTAMLKLPPQYFVPALPQAQYEGIVKANLSQVKSGVGVVRAKLFYVDNHGGQCTMLREYELTKTANAAIQEAIMRIHTIVNTTMEAAEFMFKVVGRADYIYGDESLINFRYIRDCVVKHLEVRLFVQRLPFPSSTLSAPRFQPNYAAVQKSNPEHDSLTVTASHHSPSNYISQWDVHQKLSIRFDELSNLSLDPDRIKAENLHEGDDVYISLVAEVFFGTLRVCSPQRTPWRCCKGMAAGNLSCRVLWGHTGNVVFDLAISDLPREVKVCLSIVGSSPEGLAAVADSTADQLLDDGKKGQEKKLLKFVNLMNPLALFDSTDDQQLFYLGTVNVQLFDHAGQLKSGHVDVRMWNSDVKANPIGTSSSNPDSQAIGCRMIFPTFARPVVQPSGAPPRTKMSEMDLAHADKLLQIDLQLRDNKIAQLRQIKRVLSTDPLYNLTFADKVLLWQYREDLTKRPKALCKFLLAVDWMRPAAVYKGHMLMERWATLQPMDALELLDARFADTHVRQYAIDCLDRMSDYELKTCILQLVQVLKYEPYHYSALARFLLKRSLNSPHLIGHAVFWHLKAEMYNPMVCERHGLILEEYLRRLTSRRDLLRQNFVDQELLRAALKIKESKKSERLGDLREILAKIAFPPTFSLALNPTMECRGLVIDKCKVMDSKKLPLWLVFRNSDPLGANIFIIFKAGDDLRQDLLTLQMLELMDNVWKASGLDLHMIPYGCVATGEGVGMIEIVLNSDTVANITRKDGGAQAAFSEEPMMNWLRKFNRSPADVERCLWNFVYSTAGSCVATYILGIGDRHNDNIMVREDGTLFHIDFGHFLGNFKTKFGFKRETAPFIFTPMFAYMMGGVQSPIYQYFCDIACQAYNVIRRQSNMLMILFTLMLSTGIPELQKTDDVVWLKSVLLVDANDEEATKHYRQLIDDSLNNKRTLINDYIHIIAH